MDCKYLMEKIGILKNDILENNDIIRKLVDQSKKEIETIIQKDDKDLFFDISSLCTQSWFIRSSDYIKMKFFRMLVLATKCINTLLLVYTTFYASACKDAIYISYLR